MLNLASEKLSCENLESNFFSPISIAQSLLRYKTTTPAKGEIFAHTQALLEKLGFYCKIYSFGESEKTTENLYARIGTTKPTLAFCGHLDTVPEGNPSLWDAPPYQAQIKNGFIIARGSVDMKGSVAAFIAATARIIKNKTLKKGSIVILLTGDEEGPAVFGTKALLEALDHKQKNFDACITGEPTSHKILGDRIKIGRRGSLSLRIKASGKAGHSAYPQNACNSIHSLLPILDELAKINLDADENHNQQKLEYDVDNAFQPSNLQVSGITSDTFIANMLPAEAEAIVSIRHSTKHNKNSLLTLINDKILKLNRDSNAKINVECISSAQAFYTPPNQFSNIVSDAIFAETDVKPSLTTEGGTSDSRFIHKLCPTLDFGPIGERMHAINEKIHTDELNKLAKIYHAILLKFMHEFRPSSKIS